MKTKQVEELVLQSLEHEIGGVKVYEAAVDCAVNAELKEELGKYLEQTRTHVTVLEEICGALKVDPKKETPGRQVVRTVGQALVEAMKVAKAAGDPAAAEIVASVSVPNT
jgi:rubrerythrin